MRGWIAIVMLSGLALAAPQKNGQADLLFERAVQKETADGDLKAALELYKQAVAKAGTNRTVAAKALIRMGQCYEKLGDADARNAYERVVREYGDQKDAVAEARRRLGTRGGQPAGVVARRVATPAEVWPESVREVSYDGRFLVCSAGNQATKGIYLRNVETGETRTILGENPRMRNPLRLSPDGTQIAFILGRDRSRGDSAPELHVARTDGTGLRAFTAKDLGGTPRMPNLWGWMPDGQSVLLAINSEEGKGRLILVGVSDGVVRDLGSAAAMSGSIGQAKLSPDGRFIAYTKAGGPGYMGKGIAVRSLDGSRDVSLSPDGINPLWSADGKRVLFTSNRRGPTDLWAIPVANGEPAGPAEMVRESVSWPLGVTRDGELFHKTAFEMRDLYTVAFDPQSGRPTSKATKITHRYANAGSASSPDGRFLAYTSIRDGLEPGAGDPASLIIRTMATGEDREVVPKIGLDMNLSNPQWFPDGRSLFIQPQWGRQAGKLAKVDVETGAVDLLQNGAPISAGTWYDSGATLSPDGKAVYYTSPGSQPGQGRIVRRALPDGPEMELGKVKSARSSHISVSPDGSTLAFWVHPRENANAGILMTMPAAGGEQRPVKMGAVVPWASFTAWSPDGKRIFFVGMTKPGGESWRNQESDIWSVPAEGGEPVPLRIGLHTIWFFHLHPDGRQLVFYDEYYPPSEVWSVRNLPGIGKAAR